MKTHPDEDPTNVHILLDFGTNSLMESAIGMRDEGGLKVSIKRIHEVRKQAGGDIPGYILSNTSSSSEL